MEPFDYYPLMIGKTLLQKVLPFAVQGEGSAKPEDMLRLMTEFKYALVLYAAYSTPEENVEHTVRVPAGLCEQLSREYGIAPFEFMDRQMGILCLRDCDWNQVRKLVLEKEQAIGAVLQDWRVRTGNLVNVSFGRPFIGLMNLQDAYSEIINSTVVFSLRPGKAVTSEYDIVSDPALVKDPYPRSEIERQLADAVFNLELRKAKEIMGKIMDYEMATMRLKLSFLPRMSVRVEWILIVLRVPRNSGENQSAEIYHYPSLIKYAESNARGRELIGEFFDKLEEYYNAFRFNIGKDITQITDFIKRYAGDSNLSATVICDRFRISPSYLSHMFKKRTGVKLVDYIHHVRIANAKALLENSTYTITEISTMVGYRGNSAFATKFKKYESITPREYRERANRRRTGRS